MQPLLLPTFAAIALASLVAKTAVLDRSHSQSGFISIMRENKCGFVQLDPTDLNQCPSYTVVIREDGTVEYEGRSGVRTVGMRAHRADLVAVRELFDEFERADFFSMRARYDHVDLGGGRRTFISHAVATTVVLSVGGRTKSVYDFYGAPETLRELERRVEEVGDVRRYTGRRD